MNEHAYEAPPTGMVGWLYGWCDATVPGYRKFRGASATFVSDFAVDTKGFFPSFLFQLNYLDGFLFDVDADGRVKVVDHYFVDNRDVIWLDRLGWLLGFDAEGRFNSGNWLTAKASAISPACIPLFSRTVERIERSRERSLIIDRFGRPHGHVFGGADVWRWKLRLHRTGLEAFKAGWVARGQVMLSPFAPGAHIDESATPWSPAEPGGYVVGRVLGTEGSPTAIDRIGRMYDLNLIVCTEAA